MYDNLIKAVILKVAAEALNCIDIEAASIKEAAHIMGVPSCETHMEMFTKVWKSFKSMWMVDEEMRNDIMVSASVFVSLMEDNLPSV